MGTAQEESEEGERHDGGKGAGGVGDGGPRHGPGPQDHGEAVGPAMQREEAWP